MWSQAVIARFEGRRSSAAPTRASGWSNQRTQEERDGQRTAVSAREDHLERPAQVGTGRGPLIAGSAHLMFVGAEPHGREDPDRVSVS
jgi:hypothetical protein